MYKQYLPHRELLPYIETYWITNEELSERQTIRVLPDGGLNLLFNLAENESGIIKPFIPYIIGAKTGFSDVIHETIDKMIGIRLRPCALAAYTKIPIYEFNDYRIDTSLFHSLFSDFNSEHLAEIDNDVECLLFIEQFLLDKLNYMYGIDKQIIHAVEFIQKTKGKVPVNEILDKVCLSQRQFERRFKGFTGMSPKKFSAITRFSSAERYMRAHPDKSLFALALDCGYYDHSHLTREFKRFGGALPQTLMSNLYTISPSFPYYLCDLKKRKGYEL